MRSSTEGRSADSPVLAAVHVLNDQPIPDERRARTWRQITGGTLLVGYAGYYVCRSNLSVAAPLLLEEFGESGFDKPALGLVVSAGVLAYAAGKLVTGVVGDFVGGRRMFIGGMVASVLATIAFGFSSGLAAFAIIWIVNRFVQSMGWGALVKIAAHWYKPEHYGRVMAVLSLSFLFGDAVGRYLLGTLVNLGYGWRAVFFSAAASLAVIAIGTAMLLRESPQHVGLAEPEVSPRNVFAASGASSRPKDIADLLRPYMVSPSFWLVCIVSFGLTLIRETFNGWTPTYLVEVYRFTDGEAAQMSSLFPLLGGVSVLLVGRLSDRMPAARLATAVPFLSLGVVALAALGFDLVIATQTLGLALLSTVAFLIIGPYDCSPERLPSTLAAVEAARPLLVSLIRPDTAGGVLSGYAVGRIAQSTGWNAVFRMLAVVATFTAIAAIVSWLRARHVAPVVRVPA